MLHHPAILYPAGAAGLHGCVVPDLLVNAGGQSPDGALIDASASVRELLADMAGKGESFPEPTAAGDMDLDDGTLFRSSSQRLARGSVGRSVTALPVGRLFGRRSPTRAGYLLRCWQRRSRDVRSTPALSCVAKSPDPQSDASEVDEAEVAGGGLAVSGGCAAAVLEPADAALGPVAQAIGGAVDARPSFAAAAHRDHGPRVAGLGPVSDAVGARHPCPPEERPAGPGHPPSRGRSPCGPRSGRA